MGLGNNKMKLIEDSQPASYFVLFKDHSDVQRFLLGGCVINSIHCDIPKGLTLVVTSFQVYRRITE